MDKKALQARFSWLPAKFWWLVLGVFCLGAIAMLVNTKKVSQSLVMYLPANTNFYYHWSDKSSFKAATFARLPVVDSRVPQYELNNIKGLLLDGFVDAREIVWFKTTANNEDYYLIRLDKIKQIAKWLAANKPEYSYRLIDDDILLISQDSYMVNNYSEDKHLAVTANNLGSGINIFWTKENPPVFLKNLTKWLSLDSGLPHVYLNIFTRADGRVDFHLWQTKMRQLVNASSTVDWPNEVVLSRNADLVFGFGDHQPAEWQAIVSQYMLQPLLSELPYYRLSSKKIDEQILKNNFIYLNQNNWLMASKEDWQARINDWLPDLKLQEVKNRLPDGTVYTEYVTGESGQFEKLSYQDQEYWHRGNLYGTQIASYYYLSNNETLMQSTIASSQRVRDYLVDCRLPSDASLIDMIQLGADKVGDVGIKQYFKDNQIQALTVYSYENSQQIGFRACF